LDGIVNDRKKYAARARFLQTTGQKPPFKGVVGLPNPPRSVDRIRSPVGDSQKWEYFKYPPETIGDFAPAGTNFGAQRPIATSQKPAIGGHF